MKKAMVFVIAGGLLIGYSCKNEANNNTSITKEVTFTKEGTLSIHKADSTQIDLDIEVAADQYERQTGLMYRNTMGDNQGMLFIMETEQPQSFYMKNTRFALDIIYVNAAQEIVSFQENAQPMNTASLPSVEPAKYVLEVNAGLARKWNLQLGDKLTWNID